MIPIIKAKEKYFRLSPPKKKRERTTNKTVKTVFMDLPRV
jgi:hypothetical protein